MQSVFEFGKGSLTFWKLKRQTKNVVDLTKVLLGTDDPYSSNECWKYVEYFFTRK